MVWCAQIIRPDHFIILICVLDTIINHLFIYLIITILWTFFQSHFLQNSGLLSVYIASLRIYRSSIYPIYFVDIPHYIKIITQKHLAFIPYWGLWFAASISGPHRLASNGHEVQSYICKSPDSLPKKRTCTGHKRPLPFNRSSPSGIGSMEARLFFFQQVANFYEQLFLIGRRWRHRRRFFSFAMLSRLHTSPTGTS